jgi:histidinol-phosphatase (PHP family)
MLVDYHTHHYRCGHAEGQMSQYVEAAITAGIAEIGLSDHSPIYHLGDNPHPLPQTAMSQPELPSYVAEMAELQQRFANRITVRLGVESDYVMGWDEHYRRLWQQYSLDYVIGSVHWLGDWSIFNPQLPIGRTVDDIYEEYLYTTQAAARSGVYDIIGHLDCIKTVGHLPSRAITPLLEETVQVLADSNVVIELNTSGWRKPIAECYPRPELLACCQHYGVPVTLGSDAHAPSFVGEGFAEAVTLLREVGYREITTFDRRARHKSSIM